MSREHHGSLCGRRATLLITASQDREAQKASTPSRVPCRARLVPPLSVVGRHPDTPRIAGRYPDARRVFGRESFECPAVSSFARQGGKCPNLARDLLERPDVARQCGEHPMVARQGGERAVFSRELQGCPNRARQRPSTLISPGDGKAAASGLDVLCYGWCACLRCMGGA